MYFKKYLKYKRKYLDLKKLQGGILPKLGMQPLVDSENIVTETIENINSGNFELPNGKYDFVIFNDDPENIHMFLSPDASYGHTSFPRIHDESKRFAEELNEYKKSSRKINSGTIGIISATIPS